MRPPPLVRETPSSSDSTLGLGLQPFAPLNHATGVHPVLRADLSVKYLSPLVS